MNEGLTPEIAVNSYAVGAFIGYLILIIGIGIFTTRFSSGGIAEFFLGGRKMNRFVVALSAVVSGRSAWLLLGVTGMAYKMGASAVWAVVGYIVMEMFLFTYYAKRLRDFSGKHDCITIPDFYAARFGDKNGALRSLLVFIIVIFMVSYISAQFVGGGKAFSASFQIDQTTGVLLTALIVLTYTILGGFLAVSLTDVVQAIFMMMALLFLPIAAIADKGGLGVVIDQLKSIDVSLIDPFSISIGAGLGFLGIGLGSPGNPHILVRYMSISDSRQFKVTAIVGTIWNILMAWGALFIGLAGRVYFPETSLLPGSDTENLFPLLAQQHLHPILFGIAVAAVFAAIMSTADSQLLVASSSIIVDVYEKILRRGKALSQKKLVIYSRIVVVILSCIALLLGLMAKELVFWLVLFAWAGLGASLGPTSILALFWKKTTRQGVFAGLIAGTVVTIIWYYIPGLKGIIYELVPGFVAGLIATITVSLMTEKI